MTEPEPRAPSRCRRPENRGATPRPQRLTGWLYSWGNPGSYSGPQVFFRGRIQGHREPSSWHAEPRRAPRILGENGIGFGDFRQPPAHQESREEPGRPASARAVSRPPLALGGPRLEGTAEAVRSALSQSRACLRQRAREPASKGRFSSHHVRSRPVPRRRGLEPICRGQVGGKSRRRREGLGPAAKSPRHTRHRQSHLGERHALLGVGRKFITLDDRRKPCYQSYQIPRARRQIAGTRLGSGGGGPGSTRAMASSAPDNCPSQ